ncbi:nitrile hydratase accessory protein [soil metagenome]
MNRDRPFDPIACGDNEAAFAEPWQAQILALAFASSEKGLFTPAQWSAALGAELRSHEAEHAPDERTGYYEAALRALESLLVTGGALAHETVEQREDDWRRAYLATPHGMPVELVTK